MIDRRAIIGAALLLAWGAVMGLIEWSQARREQKRIEEMRRAMWPDQPPKG